MKNRADRTVWICEFCGFADNQRKVLVARELLDHGTGIRQRHGHQSVTAVAAESHGSGGLG
jgi:hypothetical protein